VGAGTSVSPEHHHRDRPPGRLDRHPAHRRRLVLPVHPPPPGRTLDPARPPRRWSRRNTREVHRL